MKSGLNPSSYNSVGAKDRHSWTLINDQKVKTRVIFLAVGGKVTSKADMIYQVA